ncbi:translation initiation factor eIF4e [Suhomyces tanzawaensis NRRL Y-17324]|uniref:Translation initiation factor eIF4e n=1 Tax=Suhomyces tanzawaensis NRRL Y-17324 TaxID=984487 RepID=A0A1E4SGR8_9ASCO|nr:translation initiation factor eIF4e [Suhomyces tanzawaensis NRRL Y-17324]ODV78701.1 translation initiation factor eIF4e [Suhomyces tanzawaensis NRRL Y-17324]
MSENLKRAESLFNRIMKTGPAEPTRGANSHKGSYKGSYKNSNGLSSSTNHTSPHASELLPKRDPIKASEDTLSRIPADHHILPYCWTIWHHSRTKLRGQKDAVAGEDVAVAATAAAVDSYLQTTHEIEFLSVADQRPTTSIGSIEQLWMSLSSIKKSYELPIGTELLIFKSGINPVWEDPINTKGGRWVFRFNRRSAGSGNAHEDHQAAQRIRKRSSLIWERLLLKTATGSIIPDNSPVEYQELLLNDISGLVLSVRKDEDIISVWNSNLNFSAKGKKDDDKPTKKLTLFQARRIICDSILRVIRECDAITHGHDGVDTVDNGSSERVLGVSFEYRLHADNSNPIDSSNGGGKYGGHHSHHHRRYKKHDS